MKTRIWAPCMLAIAAFALHAADFVPEAHLGSAIQKAIDAASAAGGGRVALEKGATYPSGTLYLKSHVELHIPEGTVILGGGSPADYDDVTDPRIKKRPEGSDKVFIACLFAEDVSITGSGVIDGQGVLFYDTNVPKGAMFKKPPHPRTRMIEFVGCRRVRFEDVTFKDSPGWTCWMRMCEDFSATRVKINGDQRMINNDGFHIDGCRRVRIVDCNVKSGDDCIVMRAIRTPSGESELCEDMVVSNCTLNSACQCIRLGCPSDGTIRNGLFTDLRMSGNNGVMSYHPTRYLQRGGTGHCRMEDLVVENCTIDVRNHPIIFSVDKGITLNAFGNVTFRNIDLKGGRPIVLKGNGNTPLRNVRLESVKGTVAAEVPMDMARVEGISLDGVSITSGRGKKEPFSGEWSTTTWESVP